MEDSTKEEILSEENEYYTELKSLASFQGYQPADVDGWIEEGFVLEDIENCLYRGYYQ